MQTVLERMRSDPRFRKYIFSTALIALALIGVAAFFYIRDMAGPVFTCDGEDFYIDGISSRKMTLLGENGGRLVFATEGYITVTVEYNGKAMRQGGGYGGLTGFGYSFSDGSVAAGVASSDLTALQKREVRLMEDLRDYFAGISDKYKHPFLYVVFLASVIVIVAVSMHLIFFTEESWENSLLRKLFVQGGEPTEFILLAYKAVGFGAIMISVFMFLKDGIS